MIFLMEIVHKFIICCCIAIFLSIKTKDPPAMS